MGRKKSTNDVPQVPAVGRVILPSKRDQIDAEIDKALEEKKPKKRRVSAKIETSPNASTIQAIVESSCRGVLERMQQDTMKNALFVAANMMKLFSDHPELTVDGLDEEDIKLTASASFDSVDIGTGISAVHSTVLTTLINTYIRDSGRDLTPAVLKVLTAAVDKLMYDRFRGIKSKRNQLRPTPQVEATNLKKTSKMTYAEFRSQLCWNLHGGSFDNQALLLKKFVAAVIAHDRDPSIVAFLFDEPFHTDLEGDAADRAKEANDKVLEKVNFVISNPELDYTWILRSNVTIESLQNELLRLRDDENDME